MVLQRLTGRINLLLSIAASQVSRIYESIQLLDLKFTVVEKPFKADSFIQTSLDSPVGQPNG